MSGTDTNMESAVEAMADRLYLVVPDEIRRYKQWVLWRYEPGDDKPRKVPYYLGGQRRSGVQGAEADLTQLASFDDALRKFRVGGFDGIGLAVLQNSPIKAIDIDNVVKAGAVIPQAEAIVNEADSYAELSPSGGGVRILVYGVLPSKKSHNHFGPGQHLELFGTSGFVTITGNVLGDAAIRPMSTAFQAWITKQVQGSAAEPAQEQRQALVIEERQRIELRSALNYLNADEYQTWADVGMALKELGDVGRGLWLEWSQMSTRFDMRQATAKWATFAPDGRIHFQTIFFRATERGWVNPMSNGAHHPGAHQPLQAPVAPKQGLPLVFAENIDANQVQIAQLVESMLTQGGLSVMYGESNSGKSFLACDMACSIGAGMEWLGLRTVEGAVLYVAGEGSESIKLRVAAWRQKHGVSPKLAVVPVAVNLLDKGADMQRVIDACKAVCEHYGVAVLLIVIDTLARAFGGGNENSSEDMGAVIAHADTIRAATKAHVLFVHHSGKDIAKGSRGHSSLKAATDTEIEVTADQAAKLHTAEVTKQRDLGSRGEKVTGKFVVVRMGTDQWGKATTTCVVEPTTEKPATESKRKKGNDLRMAIVATLSTATNRTMKRAALVKALTDAGFTTSPIYRSLGDLAREAVTTEAMGSVHLNDMPTGGA